MNQPSLHLEILSGPLDGHTLQLAAKTTWTQAADTLLSFPWDSELSTPQARLYPEAGQWWLEPAAGTAHGTYCVNRNGRVEAKCQLESGDVLKASETWLRVAQID